MFCRFNFLPTNDGLSWSSEKGAMKLTGKWAAEYRFLIPVSNFRNWLHLKRSSGMVLGVIFSFNYATNHIVHWWLFKISSKKTSFQLDEAFWKTPIRKLHQINHCECMT